MKSQYQQGLLELNDTPPTTAQYSAAIVWVRKAQGPNRRQFGPCQGSLAADLLARRRHVGAAAVGHFGGHADAFAQCGVRVDGLPMSRCPPHLNRQGNLANHVARMRADDTTARMRWVSGRQTAAW